MCLTDDLDFCLAGECFEILTINLTWQSGIRNTGPHTDVDTLFVRIQTLNTSQGLYNDALLCSLCFHHTMYGTVYPKKYAHGFCFAVLCCGYTLTDFPISIRLTSLALWQSNDCPSASKAALMNMDKNFMWIHYERLHNHNKAKHNKTVCIFLGIYGTYQALFTACYSYPLHITGPMQEESIIITS